MPAKCADYVHKLLRAVEAVVVLFKFIITAGPKPQALNQLNDAGIVPPSIPHIRYSMTSLHNPTRIMKNI